jgi:hypothetical protein
MDCLASSDAIATTMCSRDQGRSTFGALLPIAFSKECRFLLEWIVFYVTTSPAICNVTKVDPTWHGEELMLGHADDQYRLIWWIQ